MHLTRSKNEGVFNADYDADLQVQIDKKQK